MGGEIKPKINDQFWFDYSEKLINENRTDEAAKKLQNLVLWLWGIYTTYAVIGSNLQEQHFPLWVTILIALSSASLILVYWGTTWIQMPVETSFDPRCPSEIEGAYKKITTTKISRFNKTLGASLFSAFMVSISLILMSINSSNKHNEFIAKVESLKEKKIITLTTYVIDSDITTIKILDNNNTTIKTLKIIPTKEGLIQVNIPIEKNIFHKISINWDDSKGINREISKIINHK